MTEQPHLSGPATKAPGASPAGRSARLALRTGFQILGATMLLLSLYFLLHNIYWVGEGYVAVQTRLGALVDRDGNPVRHPGGPRFALPRPLDRVYKIPTTVQTVVLDKAFHVEQRSDSTTTRREYAPKAFVPSRDGSLITADKNIVQGVWTVHYRVGDPAQALSSRDRAVRAYFLRVGSAEAGEKIVSRLAHAAIVDQVGRTIVADFVAGRIDNNRIRGELNRSLRRIRSGLHVTSVSSSKYMVPRVLEADFQSVNTAQSEKALEIEKAVRNRVSALSEMAGSDWEEVLVLIEDFEKHSGHTSAHAFDSAFARYEALLASGGLGGFAAQLCEEARMKKTAAIEEARSASARFDTLLSSYKRQPGVFTNRLLDEALAGIWQSKGVERIVVPPNTTFFLTVDK